MTRARRAEVREALTDRDYWYSVAAALDVGLVLYGWNGRSGASFHSPRGDVTIPGFLAEAVLRLARRTGAL